MPTLLGRLMARPTADLAHIAALWEVTLPGRRRAEDVAALYRAMVDVWTLRDLIERLSPNADRLLWTLVKTGAWPATTDDPIGPAANELLAVGLLHPPLDTTTDELGVLADETAALCRRLAEEHQQTDRHRLSLNALLTTLDRGELAAAAERWGIEDAPGHRPRAEVETELLEAVTDTQALDDLVNGLERADRVLFELLEASETALPLLTIRQRSGLSPAVLRRAIRHLSDFLLVWECRLNDERQLFVPAELRRRGHTAAPRRLAPVTGEPTDWRHPYALAWDLLAWLRASNLNPDTPNATPLPATYPLWHAANAAERTPYLRFLRAAAIDLNLDTPARRAEWASRSLTDQQAALVDSWRSSRTGWEEEFYADPLVGPAERLLVRAALVDVLGRLEPAAWYLVDDLAAQAAAAASRLIGSHRQTRRPQYLPPRVGLPLLQRSLVWLGLLEPGRQPQRRRPVVRMTALGGSLLSHAAPPTPEAPALVAEPSLRLLVYGVDSELLWSLLAFATPEHLDRVSLFRLNRTGTMTGLAAGLTGQLMIATLERAARHPLPESVVFALHDWARAARRARIGRALILTFDTERARDAALQLPSLRRLGAEGLPGDRLALPIDDEQAEQRVRGVLHELGFDQPLVPGSQPSSVSQT